MNISSSEINLISSAINTTKVTTNGSSVADGASFNITTTSKGRFVSVEHLKSGGTYSGKYVVDYGAFLDAVTWSDTELRVYNVSGSSMAAGDIRVVYMENQP